MLCQFTRLGEIRFGKLLVSHFAIGVPALAIEIEPAWIQLDRPVMICQLFSDASRRCDTWERRHPCRREPFHIAQHQGTPTRRQGFRRSQATARMESIALNTYARRGLPTGYLHAALRAEPIGARS